VKNEADFGQSWPHAIPMRMMELTRSEMYSVRCPTCGVAARKVLSSGIRV
jgi:hypothetical protein